MSKQQATRHWIEKAAWFAILLCLTLAFPAIAQDEASEAYREGRQALEDERWRQAVGAFSTVVAEGGSDADGALYWKAYAHAKLGEGPAALAATGELARRFPQSAWLDDARALELEIRPAAAARRAAAAERAAGRAAATAERAAARASSRVAAGSASAMSEEDELKLLALQGLMHSDSEKAVDLLERYLAEDRSQRFREQALFVLSQSESPRAREILLAAARGERGRDLQMIALHHLGFAAGLGVEELEAIYRGTDDVEVKRALLHAFTVRDDAEEWLSRVLREETDTELRRMAVHHLGTVGAIERMAELYRGEQDPEVRRAVLHSLAVHGATDQLIEFYREEKDPELKRQAVQIFGMDESEKARAFLAELYEDESDLEVRRAVIHAFGLHDNVDRLIEIARSEKDPELRREAVRWLGMNGSDEAVEFLMELLDE